MASCEQYTSGSGKVESYKKDKTEGHDEIVIRLKDGRRVIISNNTKFGIRVEPKEGDEVNYHGYGVKGTNVVHKVHPNRSSRGGWLEHVKMAAVMLKKAQARIARSLLNSSMSAARKAAIAGKYGIKSQATRSVSKTTAGLVEKLKRNGLRRLSLEEILKNAPKDSIYRGSGRDYLSLPEFQLFNQKVNSGALPNGRLGDLDIFHTANPFTALMYGPNGTFSVAPAKRSRELRKGLTSFTSHFGPGGGGSSIAHPGRLVKRDPYTYGIKSTGKPMRDFSRKAIRDKFERIHVTGYDMNYDQGYETALSRAMEPELGARVYRKVPNGNIVAPPNTGGARTLSDVKEMYPGINGEIYEDMAPIQRLIKRMYRNPDDAKFIEDSLMEFDPGFKKTFSKMRRRISEGLPYGGGVVGSGYDIPKDYY